MSQLDNLKMQYGDLMIQLEIIQGKVYEVKAKISTEMQKGEKCETISKAESPQQRKRS